MARYYLSSAGNDANPGTSIAPWKTLMRALLTAAANDFLVFLDTGDFLAPGPVVISIADQVVAGGGILDGDGHYHHDGFIASDGSFTSDLTGVPAGMIESDGQGGFRFTADSLSQAATDTPVQIESLTTIINSN
jgi:hypothetical protein